MAEEQKKVEATEKEAETKEVAVVTQAKKQVNIGNLEEKLGELTAADYIQTERECRMSGDMTPDLSYSAEFCSRLAAKALGVPYFDIRDLKLTKFYEVVMKTRGFLMKPLGESVLLQNS